MLIINAATSSASGKLTVKIEFEDEAIHTTKSNTFEATKNASTSALNEESLSSAGVEINLMEYSDIYRRDPVK